LSGGRAYPVVAWAKENSAAAAQRVISRSNWSAMISVDSYNASTNYNNISFLSYIISSGRCTKYGIFPDWLDTAGIQPARPRNRIQFPGLK